MFCERLLPITRQLRWHQNKKETLKISSGFPFCLRKRQNYPPPKRQNHPRSPSYNRYVPYTTGSGLGGCTLTVYADILVIVNLYVDFLLLCGVQSFLRLKVRSRRLVLGALAGALCSLAGLLPVPEWVSPMLGGLGSLAAAGVAFAPLRPRLFLKCWLCTWVLSFLLAGFLLFLGQFAPPGYLAVVGGAVYLDLSLPVLFAATCLAYGLFWVIRRIFPPENAAPLCRLLITNQEHTVEVIAKADTGSALREPFSGLPVVVCQAECLREAAPAGAYDFLDGRTPKEPLRLVPFESLGGRGLLPCFKPQRVALAKTGRELDCCVALTKTALSAGQFSALYNPELFPEQNIS